MFSFPHQTFFKEIVQYCKQVGPSQCLMLKQLFKNEFHNIILFTKVPDMSPVQGESGFIS